MYLQFTLCRPPKIQFFDVKMEKRKILVFLNLDIILITAAVLAICHTTFSLSSLIEIPTYGEHRK